MVAILGIAREIQRATGFTYVAGLWKEHLLTDLLWFAIDGPGCRLVGEQFSAFAWGENFKVIVYLAPTWSWVSRNVPVGQKGEFVTVVGGLLEIHGPLCRTTIQALDGSTYFLEIDNSGRHAANFFPDISFGGYA